MIKQKCNLIVFAIYFDENYQEEVALLYSPISSYYVIIPTKHILTSKKHKGTTFVTELKNAFFIPSADVEQKLREWRNRD
ncbi:hypothetical protein KQI76_04915 [Amphibacillus sp. MSJ-3]|uniref:hypothetical protein n=1 Tax=Amphibacillus sp. MSJ-3 TaxID=2841505 RepID=UPI001C0EF1FE|nr:hypothetical protein [Amphibacillus sp. MSJ-3]MBU5594498.1 hypothetical protein [Amphibacillus sp. MSJ-3]